MLVIRNGNKNIFKVHCKVLIQLSEEADVGLRAEGDWGENRRRQDRTIELVAVCVVDHS